MSEQLVRDLVELGRTVPTPEAPGLEARVLARISAPGRRPFLARPRARLVAALVAVLVALLAAPPVRAAVADWFGFGSVVVHRGDGGAGSTAPVPPCLLRTVNCLSDDCVMGLPSCVTTMSGKSSSISASL